MTTAPPEDVAPPTLDRPASDSWSDEVLLDGIAAAAVKCRRAALVCILVVLLLALLALVGHATGVFVLAGAFSAEWQPMARSTAWSLALLGASLWWWTRDAQRAVARWGAAAGGLLVAGWGVVVLLSTTGNPPPDTMAPSTAGSCCLAGAALVLTVWGAGRWGRPLAGILTALLTVFSLWMLFCYLEIETKTIETDIGIQMAITTAMAWLVFGAGLVAASGPQHILVRPLLGSSTQALLLRSFLPTMVAVVIGAGLLQSPMMEHRLGALLNTLWTLLSGGLVILLIARAARRLGGRIDRAEAARRKALEEMRQAKEMAEEHNRLKSQFLANMNHELRTPLTSVLGYTENLIDEHPDDPPLLADLKVILDRGKDLLTLINDILDYSKLEANMVKLDTTTFAISEVVEAVQLTMGPLADKRGNALRLDGAAGLGSMHTDVTRVKQCLLNLLSNANKFTARGTVTLGVRRETVEGRDGVVFRVTDTGIGMTAEQQARIFERFVQGDASTTRKYGGTGLGLVISRRLARLMGGDLVLEQSAPGAGSTFTLRLPADPFPPAPALVPAPAPSLPAGESRHPILVVDDDPAVRDLLTRLLTKEGFLVHCVARGEEVVALARQLRPQAITLDVMMTGMDGWAVLTALKSDPETATIPVVVVSIVDDRNLGFTLGAADYLVKPLDRDHLRDVLKRLCRFPSSGLALVAEDDPDLRDLLRRTLEKADWTVVEAGNGREALACMARQPPSLILLDLMMPEMDGFEFLTEVRQHPEWGSIPVVVITARELSEEDRLFLNGSALLNVQRVLRKGSFSRDDLLRQVRDLVAGAT
jgi:signal transduction histidine kinase/DNA-binding response OmpR family regulator